MSVRKLKQKKASAKIVSLVYLFSWLLIYFCILTICKELCSKNLETDKNINYTDHRVGLSSAFDSSSYGR
jgi:hypothetical protein